MLTLDKNIKSIADELYEQRSLLVMGRGFNYATCLEGALVRTDLALAYPPQILTLNRYRKHEKLTLGQRPSRGNVWHFLLFSASLYTIKPLYIHTIYAHSDMIILIIMSFN